MEIADKIEIKNKDYMCTQIIFLKRLKVYRVHSILGEEEMFMMEKDSSYCEITDKKILKEIDELLRVKNTDIIFNFKDNT